MRRDDELPVIRACYEFTAWLVQETVKFPKDYKYSLGERLQRQTMNVLELLVRARFARARRDLLEQANLELELVRFQIRLAKDLKCLAIAKYGKASQQINEIGRQIGGWLKQSTE